MAGDERIALVDIGDTLADCTPRLNDELARLQQLAEQSIGAVSIPLPSDLESQRRAVMSAPGFWRDLPPRPEGFELLALLRQAGFRIHVLSKGPYEAPGVWAEKVAWCRAHVPDVPVIITDDKTRIHGHLLVDDWLPYVQRWQKEWPSGYAIVPSQPWNVAEALGPRCLRDDGTSRSALARMLSDRAWLQSL